MTKTVKPFKTWTDFLLLFLPMIGSHTTKHKKQKKQVSYFDILTQKYVVLLEKALQMPKKILLFSPRCNAKNRMDWGWAHIFDE